MEFYAITATRMVHILSTNEGKVVDTSTAEPEEKALAEGAAAPEAICE